MEIKKGIETYKEISKGAHQLYHWRKGKDREIIAHHKKYQCRVVALTMDERGIPDSSQTRIDIAHKLIRVLTDSGILLSDIYIDPLVVPIGTNDKNGVIVLDTIRGIKEAFPEVKTVIGLSNISYGLPKEDY